MSVCNFYNPIEPFAIYAGSKKNGSQLPTPFKYNVGSFGKSFNLSAVIELFNIFDPFIFAVGEIFALFIKSDTTLPDASYTITLFAFGKSVVN
jgi:hypothetical protein